MKKFQGDTMRFILLGFAVGAIADVVLRALDFARFRPYFASRGIIEAAVIAGGIVAFVLGTAALVVDPRDKPRYLVAATVSSFFTAWLHDVTEPFGPELRAHSQGPYARLLDTLVGPFSAIVVYAMQNYT